MSYATPWTRSDPDGIPTATTDLIVSRLPTNKPIALTGVDGSVLLFVNPVEALPAGGAVLDSGEPSLTVPIVVTGSNRCDGHALSDSKKTYEFQAQVSIGDADPVGTNLSVSAADRPLLNQVIVDTCGTDHHR